MTIRASALGLKKSFASKKTTLVVFNISLINDTDSPIFYDPQLFGVQLRNEIYTASGG